MFPGMFNEYLQKDNHNTKYDLIFLSHVLEHIVNPNKFIRDISNLNNKYIFIEVPTFDYKYVDEPFGMFSDEHVNYFTFESIKNIMSNNNYNCIPASINLAQKDSEYNSSGIPLILTLWEKSNNITKAVISNDTSEIFNRYISVNTSALNQIAKVINDIDPSERLAIWGMGNHTSRLFGSTNLLDKNIVSLYDSDIKKYNYVVGQLPIQSFSKEDVLNKNIGIILVSSYTHEEAITETIKKADAKCKILKLYNK